jgi:hypothetical protein
MKPYLAVLLVAILLCGLIDMIQVCSADIGTSEPPQLEWSKTYPRPPALSFDGYPVSHVDSGSCFVQASDGGYVIVGNLEDVFGRGEHDGGNYNYSGIIIKTDSAGDLQWQRSDPILDNSETIFQTSDSGYMVVAHGYLVKLDPNGNILWNKTLGIPIQAATQAEDGGYILAGNNYQSDIIMKIDENGLLIWNYTLGDIAGDVTISQVEPMAQGGYIILAYPTKVYNRGGVPDPNLWIIRTNSTGNFQSVKMYLFPRSALAPTVDGGWLLAGPTTSNPEERSDSLITKFDSQGEFEWNRTYNFGLISSLKFVMRTSDGGYFATGREGISTTNWANFDTRHFIVKVDSAGNVEWNYTFSKDYEEPNEIFVWGPSSWITTKDGGYAFLGNLKNSILLGKFAPVQSSPSPTPNSTPNVSASPSVSELLPAAAIVVLAASMLTAIAVLLRRRNQS